MDQSTHNSQTESSTLHKQTRPARELYSSKSTYSFLASSLPYSAMSLTSIFDFFPQMRGCKAAVFLRRSCSGYVPYLFCLLSAIILVDFITTANLDGLL